MSNALLDRLKAASTIKETAALDKSTIFNNKDIIQTSVPMINVALSGSLEGGLTSGLTILAGPSKHFKTAFTLLMAAAYQKQYSDSIILFYDSEFGTPDSYVKSFGIDSSRVLHTPITNIEELKFDIMQQLGGLTRKDKVIIIIDSIGNLASKKEVDDAEAGKSVADMTRAKQLKSLFRMVTPHLTIKDIPMVVVNHTYQTQEMYSKAVVSGGTGIYYSADNIWILGRQADKDKDKDLKGYHFIINIEKSRYVVEKSKIPITVNFDGGIQKWSGLLEIATEAGFVYKPKPGYYQRVDPDTGEITGDVYKEINIINNAIVWEPLLKDPRFAAFIKDQFTLSGSLLTDDEVKPIVVEDVLEDEDE